MSVTAAPRRVVGLTAEQLAALQRLPAGWRVIGASEREPILRAPSSRLKIRVTKNGRLVLADHPAPRP